jgi:protocatechuate 3,4-dioxygenase, beta subunit
VRGAGRSPTLDHYQLADRKVTQMFFEGEPLNDQDRIFQASLRPNWASAVGKALPPAKGMEPDSLVISWDVILDQG